MNNLSALIKELSRKDVTRKQFIVILFGGLIGMMGGLHFMQALNMPQTADQSQETSFGELDYGGPIQKT